MLHLCRINIAASVLLLLGSVLLLGDTRAESPAGQTVTAVIQATATVEESFGVAQPTPELNNLPDEDSADWWLWRPEGQSLLVQIVCDSSLSVCEICVPDPSGRGLRCINWPDFEELLTDDNTAPIIQLTDPAT